MDPLPLAVFVGSIIILVGAIALDRVVVRRRCHSCQECAAKLGLTYEAKAAPFAGTDVSGLGFLDQGASTVARNVLRGSSAAGAMVVFDLTLFNPTEVAFETTFAVFRSARGKLPVFQLGAKHAVERVREALAPKSVPVADPEFRQRFYLHSRDAAVQDFLTAEKLAQLRQQARDYRIESSPDWLVAYRSGVKVRARDLAQFIDETATLAAGLLYPGPDVLKPAGVR